ncbi:MAG: hypothetical protein FWB90_00695 [Fibromonadales bacterium]|nr:hypothetical protein [Fibromonadales bacterium]
MSTHIEKVKETESKVKEVSDYLHNLKQQLEKRLYNVKNGYTIEIHDALYNKSRAEDVFIDIDFRNTKEDVKSVKIYVELDDGIKSFEFKREAADV